MGYLFSNKETISAHKLLNVKALILKLKMESNYVVGNSNSISKRKIEYYL